MRNAKPAYLISGGPSTDQRQLVDDLHVALSACGAARPHVAYVGTATHDNEQFFDFMKRPLVEAGAHVVEMAPIAGASADIEKARRMLLQADAVYLSGGEPEDGMEGLVESGLDRLLVEQYQQGKLFIGISAGAIMMGRYWVHWDTKGDDETSRLIDCLGFFPMTFDAHGEAEDWKELRCALSLMGPGSQGYGLSTGGFYCVDGEGNLISFRNDPAILGFPS